MKSPDEVAVDDRSTSAWVLHFSQMNACLGCGKDTELYDRGEPMCPACSEAKETELRAGRPFKEPKPPPTPQKK
jgi:predicted amidophosphoribosyltransferase